MRLLAPAKINLHLRVGPPRAADGFHPLVSWMCCVGLFDTLTISTVDAVSIREERTGHPPSPSGDRSAGPPWPATGKGRAVATPGGLAGVDDGGGGLVTLTCDLPGLSCDADNLVSRAARGLADALAADVGAAAGAVEGGGPTSVAAPAVDARDHAPHRGGGDGGATASGAVGAAAGGPVGGAPPPRVVPVVIALGKQIPLGAGLGGGSSDAARTLLGLNRLWRAGATAADLSAVAAALGSDVPFFVHAGWRAGPSDRGVSGGGAGAGSGVQGGGRGGESVRGGGGAVGAVGAADAVRRGSALCAGRGELVRPVPPPARARWAVLVLPPLAMPTAQVYRRFDDLGLGREEGAADEPPVREWAGLAAGALLPLLQNDLEPAAFSIAPALGDLRRDIEWAVGRPVRMSGSGSSLFTLYDDQPAAAAGAAAVAARFGGDGVRALAIEVAPELKDDLGADE